MLTDQRPLIEDAQKIVPGGAYEGTVSNVVGRSRGTVEEVTVKLKTPDDQLHKVSYFVKTFTRNDGPDRYVRFRNEAKLIELLQDKDMFPKPVINECFWEERGYHYFALRKIDGFSADQLYKMLTIDERSALNYVHAHNGETMDIKALNRRAVDGAIAKGLLKRLTSGDTELPSLFLAPGVNDLANALVLGNVSSDQRQREILAMGTLSFLFQDIVAEVLSPEDHKNYSRNGQKQLENSFIIAMEQLQIKDPKYPGLYNELMIPIIRSIPGKMCHYDMLPPNIIIHPEAPIPEAKQRPDIDEMRKRYSILDLGHVSFVNPLMETAEYGSWVKLFCGAKDSTLDKLWDLAFARTGLEGNDAGVARAVVQYTKDLDVLAYLAARPMTPQVAFRVNRYRKMLRINTRKLVNAIPKLAPLEEII